MSDITELARAEADAAEAEDSNGLDAADELVPPEPEPEPEPDALIDEAAIRKAERALSDQKARLGKILGDAMVAHDCPLCSALGYLPELPPPGTVLEVTETESGVGFEVRAAGLAKRYKQARDKEGCPECDAEGIAETGSKNPNAITAQCSRCDGNGWVLKAIDAPQNVYVQPPAATSANGPAPGPMQVPPDAWERPYGHPHYGMPPSMVGAAGS